MKVCSINGCEGEHEARGWCGKHYQRWRKLGGPHLTKTDVEYRFQNSTEWQGDCLIWTGWTDRHGYGYISHNGVERGVHRYAWEREHGEIPEGIFIDHHVCYNPLCCNVEHLREATQRQNNFNKSKLHSKNSSGHRNVVWNSQMNKWQVLLTKDYKKYHFGFYTDIEEAAKVAEQARKKKLFGEFAGRG